MVKENSQRNSSYFLFIYFLISFLLQLSLLLRQKKSILSGFLFEISSWDTLKVVYYRPIGNIYRPISQRQDSSFSIFYFLIGVYTQRSPCYVMWPQVSGNVDTAPNGIHFYFYFVFLALFLYPVAQFSMLDKIACDKLY